MVRFRDKRNSALHDPKKQGSTIQSQSPQKISTYNPYLTMGSTIWSRFLFWKKSSLIFFKIILSNLRSPNKWSSNTLNRCTKISMYIWMPRMLIVEYKPLKVRFPCRTGSHFGRAVSELNIFLLNTSFFGINWEIFFI